MLIFIVGILICSFLSFSDKQNGDSRDRSKDRNRSRSSDREGEPRIKDNMAYTENLSTKSSRKVSDLVFCYFFLWLTVDFVVQCEKDIFSLCFLCLKMKNSIFYHIIM